VKFQGSEGLLSLRASKVVSCSSGNSSTTRCCKALSVSICCLSFRTTHRTLKHQCNSTLANMKGPERNGITTTKGLALCKSPTSATFAAIISPMSVHRMKTIIVDTSNLLFEAKIQCAVYGLPSPADLRCASSRFAATTSISGSS